MLGLVVSLGIGTLVISDRKDEADWKGLVEYLENSEPSDLVSAPNIEQIVAFRYPDFKKRKLALEDLVSSETAPSDADGPDLAPRTRRVHLVLYRSLTPVQLQHVGEVLSQANREGQIQLRGFEIHVLSTRSR